ncbi:hypothetical protein ABZ027_30855 [Streptomyces sp. NPDC006332]|uniref:hypothetical protein n=1 Tax=Streptomyces sp. NPDC006332 TaxID=3155456 RepID=UPI0033AFF0F9
MPGTVLLLAAAPVGKGCLVDAASVLPVLAAVSPAVLSGTDTANVVELADPLEPQAVLTRLRAAATAPGPLTVFLTGQLLLDRRQHLPHLALARTTTSTARYTAFPWHWIREELRLRTPGSTALFLDLHADAETWAWLRANPLDCGRGIAVYGRIAPPPSRRTVAAPGYMKAIATILRSGRRPDLLELHQQALARLGSEAYGDLVVTVPAAGGGAPVPPAGRQVVVPAPAGGVPVPPAVPQVVVPAPGGAAPRPPYRPERPRPQTPDGLEVTAPDRRPDADDGLQAPARDRRPDADNVLQVPARRPVTDDQLKAPARRSDPDAAPQTPDRRPVTDDQLKAPARRSDPDAAPQIPDRRPAPDDDPHAYITEAVQSGRHGDADALAAEHEKAAVRAHGPGSEQALHWAEVRADLAMFAGDPVRSCRTWLAVAGARLTAGQTSDSPAVEAAVDRAHHQWSQIRDLAPARELGSLLAELRGRVPGRRQGALENIHRQLRQLQTQS